MKLPKIKKIAAKLLKVGETKVWFDPSKSERIAECMTKEDIRAAIAEGAIKKKKTAQHSRGKARVLHEKKTKGRKRGMGKRKGKWKARVKTKKRWMMNVRAQRKKLKEMKENGTKLKVKYSKVYRMIKGGYFRGKKYVESYATKGK